MADDWTVVAQGQGQNVGPTGGLLDVWRVTIATIPEGIQAFVDIPLADWQADPVGSVAAVVQPLVDSIKQTGAL